LPQSGEQEDRQKGLLVAIQPDYSSILQQSTQQAAAAIQPALQQLESTKPTLQQQYQSALGQIKEQQQAETSRTQTATSREFGKRGIPLSSGVFDTTLNEQLAPIGRYYTGQGQQADVNYQNSLNSLLQQIAGLQSGANQNAISAAQGLYGQQLGNYNAELDRAAQERQSALTRSSSASLQSQFLAAQAAAAREAETRLTAKEHQSQLSGALNYLTGAAFNNPNTTVDSNELDMAYQYLINQGLDKNSAISTIKSAFNNQGLEPYRLSSAAQKFYGL